MKIERLTALTIMNIHREAEVDYEKVVQQFLRLQPRKQNYNILIIIVILIIIRIII